MDIGNRLKALRENRGLTLEDIGNHLGVNKATVHRYESGDIDIKRNIAIKLAEVLNTTPAYIMGWDNNESKQPNWTMEALSESPLFDNSIPVELKRGVFANNVMKYMLKNNVGQKDICDLLGVDSVTVSKWLDGDELPNVKAVDALADFLHVKRNNLLDRKNTSYSNPQEKATALPDDALEVAKAYTALPDDKAKNMIRGALGLTALKRGNITANNVEAAEESHPNVDKKAI